MPRDDEVGVGEQGVLKDRMCISVSAAWGFVRLVVFVVSDSAFLISPDDERVVCLASVEGLIRVCRHDFHLNINVVWSGLLCL